MYLLLSIYTLIRHTIYVVYKTNILTFLDSHEMCAKYRLSVWKKSTSVVFRTTFSAGACAYSHIRSL